MSELVKSSLSLSNSSVDEFSVLERDSAARPEKLIKEMQDNHLIDQTEQKAVEASENHCLMGKVVADANIEIDNVINSPQETYFNLKQNVEIHNSGTRCFEINQKIFLPHDYDPSQIVKIKIIIPKKLSKKREHIGNFYRPDDIETTFPEGWKTPSVEFDLVRHSNRLTSEEYFKDNEAKKDDSRRCTIPIMGRNALMRRTNYIKCDTETDDSKIVQELVLERYKEILNNFSRKRCNSRRLSSIKTDDYENNSNPDWGGSENLFEHDDVVFSEQCLGGTFTQSSILNQSDERMLTLSNEKLGDTFSFSEASYLDHSLSDNADEAQYDSRLFLQAALGDEINSCSSGLNCFISSRTSDTNPNFIDDNSVGTSDMSCLISAHSLYASDHKRNRKVIREEHKSPYVQQSIPERNSSMITNFNESTQLNPEFDTMMHELNAQQEIILQVSKALRFCIQNKQFMDSFERMEAERVLLIASERKNALQQELEKIGYEDIPNFNSVGRIRISKLCFPLKQLQSKTKKAVKLNPSIHYYICLVRCGSVILASDIAIPDSSGNICFDKTFYINRLFPDFEIIISIYCMKVEGYQRKNSQESLARSKRDSKTLCPKFRIFKLKRKIKEDEYFIQNSSFTPYGKHSVWITNMTEPEFQLFNSPLSSPLEGIFTADFHTQVEMFHRKEGFLTIGEEVNNVIIWNRLWCRMLGPEFTCYYYPEESDPCKTVDLTCSFHQQINLADRSLCPRPRTLLLEFGPNSDNVEFRVSKLYLSADNSADLQNWQSHLNNVLLSLIQWNCMKDYFYNS